MERLVTDPDFRSNRRKPRLWDRIRRNSSSPSLRRVGIKNWSTQSLPRLGSSASTSISSTRPKSTSSGSPVEEAFAICEISLQKRDQIQDHFSPLPSEVKLQILSFLPIKTVARASLVQLKSNCVL